MNPPQSDVLEFSEEQFEYIQSHLPLGYSLMKIPARHKEKQKNVVEEIPEIAKEKRPRKCPLDPHYEIDYEFYKNKKSGTQTETVKPIPLSLKEINSCRNLMELLRKYLGLQSIPGKGVIEAEIEQIQNKLRKTNYTSVKQFMTQLKLVWKNLLNSHNKEDPVYKTCILMEEYTRELLSNMNKKRISHSFSAQKQRSDKKMTPEEKYLSTKTNKRSHPDALHETPELGQKRKLKRPVPQPGSELQQQIGLQPSKVSQTHLMSPNNEMNPEPTEASLAISPSND